MYAYKKLEDKCCKGTTMIFKILKIQKLLLSCNLWSFSVIKLAALSKLQLYEKIKDQLVAIYLDIESSFKITLMYNFVAILKKFLGPLIT